MSDVVLCECFARDGLQHEAQFLPTALKVELIGRFAQIGFQRIEATSYSNPAVVPQFSDASALLQALPRHDGVHYKATCANVRAVERAIADCEAGYGANEVSLLVSASESHSRKNLKSGRAEQWEKVAQMGRLAAGRFRLVGTISVAFGCPFEGVVPVEAVLHDVERFLELGANMIAFGDTTGMATPRSVQRLFAQVLARFPQAVPVAHFHDSRGTGLVNCVAAYDAGVRYFDCAFGGVGGHPAKVQYGGGYTGNVCSEDLIALFESMGIDTGIRLAALLDVARQCEQALGRSLHGHVTLTGLNPLPAVPA